MLVLARKRNQAVVLREKGKPDIRIWMINYDRGVYRIGVDAPKNVEIVREELINERNRNDKQTR